MKERAVLPDAFIGQRREILHELGVLADDGFEVILREEKGLEVLICGDCRRRRLIAEQRHLATDIRATQGRQMDTLPTGLLGHRGCATEEQEQARALSSLVDQLLALLIWVNSSVGTFLPLDRYWLLRNL